MNERSKNTERLGTRRTRSESTAEVNKKADGVFKNVKAHTGRYTWLDSPIDASWYYITMEDTFERLLPQSVRLHTYIEKLLEDKASKARGLELGGVGARMFRGFSPDFFAQTAGVALADERSPKKQKLTQSNHRVFERNIFDDVLLNDLKEYFGSGKIDFIIERMAKGLEFVPKDPYLIGKEVQKWYTLLSDGGVMFVQVPVSFRHLLPVWARILRMSNITFEYDEGIQNASDESFHPTPVFFLQKTAESPEELPLLTPREVHDLYKQEGRL